MTPSLKQLCFNVLFMIIGAVIGISVVNHINNLKQVNVIDKLNKEDSIMLNKIDTTNKAIAKTESNIITIIKINHEKDNSIKYLNSDSTVKLFARYNQDSSYWKRYFSIDTSKIY